MTRQLNLCPEITSPHWQLQDKLNFGLPIALLAWSRDAADVDGDPPLDVADLLAKALVQAHRVSFLVPDQALPIAMAAAGSSSVQSIPSRGVVSALAARLNSEPTRWNWLSTVDAQVARKLFDQVGFDWTLQAQVVLLSSADAPAPVLDLELTQALWRGGSPDQVPALRAAGVQCVLRPGVDGSVAGLVGLADGQAEAWVRDLEGLCRAEGWAVVRMSDH